MRTLAEWNLDFTKQRRANMRRKLRHSSLFNPKGKGNKAWKRADAMDREPGTIIWPNYAICGKPRKQADPRPRTRKWLKKFDAVQRRTAKSKLQLAAKSPNH